MNYKRLFIENSYIFLTVVINKRQSILIENIDLLRKTFQNTKNNYDFEVYAIVILPEHFHLLLKPKNIYEYPKIISSIKHYFSRNYNAVGQVCPTYGRDKGIWQRRYYEHTIRDENDLNNHLDYIHYNPVKHGHAKIVKDWKFSSFHKFVKINNYDIDWGSSKDVENIKDLNFE